MCFIYLEFLPDRLTFQETQISYNLAQCRSAYFSKIISQDLSYPINILRTAEGQVLESIFNIVMTVFVAFNTFMMGTQLKVLLYCFLVTCK